jgi:hypothetical protein
VQNTKCDISVLCYDYWDIIVESGVKHHKPNQTWDIIFVRTELIFTVSSKQYWYITFCILHKITKCHKKASLVCYIESKVSFVLLSEIWKFTVCQKKFNNKIKKQLFFTGQQKDVRLKSNTTASVLFNYLISYCDTDWQFPHKVWTKGRCFIYDFKKSGS